MTAAEKPSPGGVVSTGLQARLRAAMLTKYRPRSWDGQSDGDRLVDHHGHELRHVVDAGGWAFWDGSRWSTDGAATEVLRRARLTVDALPRTEAQHYSPDPDVPSSEYDPLAVDADAEPAHHRLDKKSDRARFLAYVRSLRKLGAHNAMVVEASGTGALRVKREEFDQHAMLFSAGNGVLHLSDMSLSGHDPDLLMMLGSDVEWDPDASCPAWLELLEKALPGPAARDHLQRWVGYSMTGRTDERAVAVHYGPAKDVRRAVFEVLREVFGTYAQTVPKNTLVERPNDTSVPNDLARMVGRRLLVALEPVRNAVLDEETIGQVTDGMSIPARHMRGEWFEFRPAGKLHLLCTHMPGFGADAPAAARSMQVIRWHRTIERSELAALVERVVGQELPGVLAWAARGCTAWQRAGLVPPTEVTEDTEAALFHGSALAQWRDARLRDVDPERFVELREVYPDYAQWASNAGEKPLPETRLGRALAEQFGIRRDRGPKSVGRRAVLYGVELDTEPFRAAVEG